MGKPPGSFRILQTVLCPAEINGKIEIKLLNVTSLGDGNKNKLAISTLCILYTFDFYHELSYFHNKINFSFFKVLGVEPRSTIPNPFYFFKQGLTKLSRPVSNL